MSSQGPVGTTDKADPPFCTGPTVGTTGSSNYVFSTASIRDGSDWIAYKKQLLIRNENKTKLKAAFPEISYGNDYRIQYLLGTYKAGEVERSCESTCDANAFRGIVPNPSS